MDRLALGIGDHLIEDIGELQVEFILGHITDMGCRQHVGVPQKRVACIRERLAFENIDGGVYPAAIHLRFQRSGGDKAGA